jgi:hypothetical protein
VLVERVGEAEEDGKVPLAPSRFLAVDQVVEMSEVFPIGMEIRFSSRIALALDGVEPGDELRVPRPDFG